MEIVQYFLLLVICSFQEMKSLPIYVSRNGGEDVQSCGTLSSPCASIQFAIKNISRNKADEISIDGGASYPSVYEIDEVTVLKHNIHLTKHIKSNVQPIIKYSGPSTQIKYAFVIPKNASISVTIDSIDFVNIGIIYCNMSMECNVTINNSNSFVNNAPMTGHTGQLLIHDFLISRVLIQNSSFVSTMFAMHVFSSRTGTFCNISLNLVKLESSKFNAQLKGNDCLFSGIFNKITAKLSSSVFIISRKTKVTFYNSSFIENKDNFTINHLLHLQSSTRCNESFFRITNVHIYSNKNYNKLIYISGTSKKQMIVLENIFVDFNELRGNESAVIEINTGNAIIQNVSVNNRNKQVDFIFKLPGPSWLKNITMKEINTTKMFDLSGGNDSTISDVKCSDSARIDYGFYANSINNTKISNLTFHNITKIGDYTLNTMLSLTNVHNVVIENIYINTSNFLKVIIMQHLKNISLKHVLIEYSKIDLILATYKGLYANINNIKVSNSKIDMVFKSATKYLTATNILIGTSSLDTCFLFNKMSNSLVSDVRIEANQIIQRPLVSYRNEYIILSNWNITRNKMIASEIYIGCNPTIGITDACVDLIDWSMSQNNMLKSAFKMRTSYVTTYDDSFKRTAFTVHGLMFWNNAVKKYVFEIEEKNKVVFRSSTIKNNSYDTCIYIINSCSEIDNVTIKGNHAHGLVKEIHLVFNKNFKSVISQCMQITHIIISKLDLSSFEANPAVINDVILFKFMFTVTIVVFNTTLRVLPFQTRGLRIMVSSSDKVALRTNFILICPPRTFYLQQSNRMKRRLQTMYSCEVCPKDTYKLLGYYWSVKEENLRVAFNRSVYDVDKCKRCPYGSTCNEGQSVGKGNFFGYESGNSTMVYVPCPMSYCCSIETKRCTSRDMCSFNRTGTLCGECIANYQENVFQDNCIKSSVCNIGHFWVFHMLAAASILLVYCFMDCAGTISSSLSHFCRKCFVKCFYSKETSLSDTMSNNMTSFVSSNNDSNATQYFSSRNTMQINTEKSLGRIKVSSITPNILDSGNDLKEESFTISGIIQITISFYQLRSLIYIEFNDDQLKFPLLKGFDDLINIKMPLLEFGYNFCPYIGVDAVGKAFINNVMLTVTMLCFLLVLYITSRIKYYRNPNTRNKTILFMPFCWRLEVCYLRLLLFSYKNIATFCLVTLSCIPIGNRYVLYIKGTTQCLQHWQFLTLGFLILWVIPFPFTLSYTFKLYRKHYISFHLLLLCVTFPAVGFVIFITFTAYESCIPKCRPNVAQLNMIKQMFEDPYRLQNDDESDKYVFWDIFRICKSLVISVVVTFTFDPLWKNVILMPFTLLFLFIYIKVRPLKKNLVVLHWMEMVQSLALCYIVLVNLFKAFLYVFSIPKDGPVESIKLFVAYSELIASPMVVIVIYFIIIPVIFLGREKAD